VFKLPRVLLLTWAGDNGADGGNSGSSGGKGGKHHGHYYGKDPHCKKVCPAGPPVSHLRCSLSHLASHRVQMSSVCLIVVPSATRFPQSQGTVAGCVLLLVATSSPSSLKPTQPRSALLQSSNPHLQIKPFHGRTCLCTDALAAGATSSNIIVIVYCLKP